MYDGGRGLPLFIEGIFGLHAASCCMLQNHVAWGLCPYPPAQLLLNLISSARKFWQLFTIFFGAAFRGFLIFKIGHSWYCWKAWDVDFPMVSIWHESELGWESYGSRKKGCSRSFSLLFQWRFRPNRRCYRWTESCSSYLRLYSFLKILTCRSNHSELGRLCTRRWFPGWKNVSNFQHNFLTVSLKVLIPINWLINPRIFM